MDSLNLLAKNCAKINLDMMQSETENVFPVSGEIYTLDFTLKIIKISRKIDSKLTISIIVFFEDWYSEKHKCRLDFLMRKIIIDRREIIFKKNKKLKKEYKKRENENQKKS